MAFYVPLSATSILALGANSIIAAGISRMPLALESLAAWPVLTGVTFLVRSFGVSYNEVVVALVERPRSYLPIRRFAFGLAGWTTLGLCVFLLPPVKTVWFEEVIGISPSLAAMVQKSIWLVLPLPAFACLQSWFQGMVLHGRRTRSVTEAVVVFLLVLAATLLVGVAWGAVAGLYVGAAALALAEGTRTLWLWWRSGRVRAWLRHPAEEGQRTRS